MASLKLRNKRCTLTSLPLSIQARILAYLCPHQPFIARTNRSRLPIYLPFKDPPVTISLHCAETLTTPLPSELISPALASPILATAAANLLGDRVSYLTYRNTSGQLSKWVTAFAPFVKAVSTRDPFLSWWLADLRDTDASCWLPTFDTEFEHSIQLFKPLSLDDVRLEVLDLQDVHFIIWSSKTDDLLAGICGTLERNSATLRELALPVFNTLDIFEKALEMSSLSKLDVLTIKLWNLPVIDHSITLVPPFLRIIRAIDGHADRTRKLTTLRELRFLHFQSCARSFIAPSDRDSSVFYSVKSLRLFMDTDVDVEDDVFLFVSLFKNLERLFWNLAPDPSDKLLAKLCTEVPEVHFSSSRWITMPLQVGATEHYEGRCSLFEETSSDSKRFGSGSIRTFFAGGVSRIDVRNMMKYCSSLENLSVHVSRENMRAIRKLVQKCQQMKCLELVVDERQHGRLDDEDWRSISRIIPKLHRNLCQVAVQTLDVDAPATSCVDAVFRCFETMTKALGERARRLVFRMVFRTRWGATIIEKICGVLNVCLQHTSALESIEFRTYVWKADRSNYMGEWEQGVVKRFSQLETQLLSEIQSLRILDLGISPFLRKHVKWDHETPETDSIRSTKELASSQ